MEDHLYTKDFQKLPGESAINKKVCILTQVVDLLTLSITLGLGFLPSPQQDIDIKTTKLWPEWQTAFSCLLGTVKRLHHSIAYWEQLHIKLLIQEWCRWLPSCPLPCPEASSMSQRPWCPCHLWLLSHVHCHTWLVLLQPTCMVTSSTRRCHMPGGRSGVWQPTTVHGTHHHFMLPNHLEYRIKARITLLFQNV